MAIAARVTLDEFLRMPDDEKPALEFACGEITQKPMPDRLHSTIQMYLGVMLFQFLRRTGMGEVLPEFRCIFGPPGRERAFVPDLAVVAKGRLAADPYLHAAPDIAIEVLSPGQSMVRFIDKIQFYLLYGVRLVWVIDPESSAIAVLRPNREATVLGRGSKLDGEDVLPGFSLNVDDIFAEVEV